MREEFIQELLKSTGAEKVIDTTAIQSLWSGYGKIARHRLCGGELTNVISKHIVFPTVSNHPRGWNTDNSSIRKAKSYEVEMTWYNNWSEQCDDSCRVPICYGTKSFDFEHLLLLEDLDASGFPVRKTDLSKKETLVCLDWLAAMHATFLNSNAPELWEVGTYWHLATRPDEFKVMADGPLKLAASTLDALLNNCEYQTLVHGDAKVANFCFSKDGSKVAAVDFQYIGKGCGIKDVVYFFSSCLSSKECTEWEEELLDFYFIRLKEALEQKNPLVDADQLEKEWRRMYPVAWADFTRFLLGWMPTHRKLNAYSEFQVNKALKILG